MTATFNPASDSPDKEGTTMPTTVSITQHPDKPLLTPAEAVALGAEPLETMEESTAFAVDLLGNIWLVKTEEPDPDTILFRLWHVPASVDNLPSAKVRLVNWTGEPSYSDCLRFVSDAVHLSLDG